LLLATGVAGRPGSHFHEPALAHWMQVYGIAPDARPSPRAAVFAAALARGRDGGAVFGLRLQRRSAEYFFEQLAEVHPGMSGDHARIAAAFGRTAYLYLHREDKVAQAVSRALAEQSGLWHRHADGSELERMAPPKEPVYDAALLRAHVAQHTAWDAAWRAWFATAGVRPFEIRYEDLAAAPHATLAAVLAHLGLPADAARGVAVPTARLWDARNAAWCARFRAERGSG
ncbi:MAG: Stf0 family sulfotransferase, partial [Pseudomonadota bacterium]